VKARTAFAGKNYCYYCFFSVVLSVLLDELELDGALEPLAAPLLGVVEALPLGAVVLPLVEPLVAPPAAGALLSVEDDELELDGELGVTVAEPDAEPDGALGELVEPDEEDAPEPGVRVTVRSPSLSQPSKPAPSARDTATASVESLI
jgi:hypothetical protein